MAIRASPFDIQDSDVLDDEFSKFCTNLETIQKKFLGEWISTWKEECEQKISKDYEKAILGCQADIENLKQNTRDLELKQAQMRELTEQIRTIKIKHEESEESLADKKTKLKEQLEVVDAESTDLDALEKVTASKKAKNKEQISFYQQRLGLEFKNMKGEGQLKVIFTNIDDCDHDRQFSFQTKIDQSKYLISCCSPPLKELEGLVDELNESNNFLRFVVDVRKAFKKTSESKENNAPSPC